MQLPAINESWSIERKSTGMTRRFNFDSYDETRRFLDDLADLSERVGYYPNLNFNRTQVNVSIESESGDLSAKEYEFAAQTDALFEANLIQGD